MLSTPILSPQAVVKDQTRACVHRSEKEKPAFVNETGPKVSHDVRDLMNFSQNLIG